MNPVLNCLYGNRGNWILFYTLINILTRIIDWKPASLCWLILTDGEQLPPTQHAPTSTLRAGKDGVTLLGFSTTPPPSSSPP